MGRRTENTQLKQQGFKENEQFGAGLGCQQDFELYNRYEFVLRSLKASLCFGMLIRTTVSHLSFLPFGIWGNRVSFGPENFILGEGGRGTSMAMVPACVGGQRTIQINQLSPFIIQVPGNLTQVIRLDKRSISTVTPEPSRQFQGF